jgi:prepilin-type N-terminal cleavage/methylation domain-containing protein
MRGNRGFSLVEVLVASAIMLTITAAVFTLLADAVRRSPLWNDDADVQQRARVAVEAIAAELRRAGAGSADGPLRHVLAVVEPRRVNGAVTVTAVTVRYVPDDAPIAGFDIANVSTITMYFDAASGTLRREEPGHGDFPVVDAIDDIRFEYADGSSLLPLELFDDGPPCEAGGITFDCDVLRIRAIRVTVRLRARLGRAITTSFEVAPWNLQL